ncbi:hypothetical protein [Nostoc sp. FACHB-110]|uniref:DUF7219 family protein n=1 Tax=Nostoc sp. FACHB-110 TaxID=2692834 RepID=UPI001F55590E|nr:hypothetical protein [Nostoc sp. FACHB-110]
MPYKGSFLSILSNIQVRFLYGQVKPENLIFNANLQEFAQKVGIITSLETNGKLTSQEAYKKIKSLWKQLKRSKKQLFNNNDSSTSL